MAPRPRAARPDQPGFWERYGYNNNVVVLKSDTRSAVVANAHARSAGARILAVYGAALKGYAARLTPAQLAAVRADPRVAFVEADRTVSLSTTQTNAPWGLDRIDQRARPLSTTFTYFNTGSGVRAYIIDTGIRFSHSQFGGRASTGFDAVDGGSADDCHGHGTHVAGTVGGSTYGVAKGVRLIGVRVLNCSGSGTTSGVIAGVNWVTGNHQAGQPAVANMSLGGGASSALDTAVRNSIADGVSYAIAAGNGNALGIAQNACNSSPARVGEAMTISATDSSDRKASWANYGNCVDWFAPGVSIRSAWYNEQHRHEDDQRHLDGDAAHRGRGCPLPPEESERVAGERPHGALQPDDQGRRHVVVDDEQPPAVHELPPETAGVGDSAAAGGGYHRPRRKDLAGDQRGRQTAWRWWTRVHRRLLARSEHPLRSSFSAAAWIGRARHGAGREGRA